MDKDLTKSPKKKFFEENGAVENAKQNRTTKNWVEEELSKFPIKKNEKEKKKGKKDTKRQSKCHVFVKQVVFLTVNHRGPLPVRELHSTGEIWCGETLGDLEPVYDLLTDEITRPEAVTQTVRYRVCTAGGFSYG